jgi:deazaflavin-dependent oxidoreductase (nitroreductase family)
LTYLRDGERFIVIASNAGDDRDPSWWLNLRSDPLATVMVDGRTLPVMATELAEPERSVFLDRFISEIHRDYAEYQRRTSRKLPVIELLPAPL